MFQINAYSWETDFNNQQIQTLIHTINAYSEDRAKDSFKEIISKVEKELTESGTYYLKYDYTNKVRYDLGYYGTIVEMLQVDSSDYDENFFSIGC